MATRAPHTDGRRKAAAARRRARKEQIIAATRELFDSRGVRDVQIEEIASAVGINRAIVYRHFTGKEELFALTLVGYLDELHDAMQGAAGAHTDAPDRLAAVVGAFIDYGVDHPAFVDCAQALMVRPGEELLDEMREGFLAFMEEKGHTRLPSWPLVPRPGDTSTLLTTAGMQPQMPYFLEREQPLAGIVDLEVGKVTGVDNGDKSDLRWGDCCLLERRGCR